MVAEKEERVTQLNKAWRRYRDNNDIAARDFIHASYMPLVDRIAREIMRKKPSNFDKEDLVQAGAVGLLGAIEKFDLERGVLFSTFALPRVRGSIFDEINSMDWTPRLVRERIKLILRASEVHYSREQNPPSDEEIANITKEMGRALTPAQVNEVRGQANKTYVHPVDNAIVIETEEQRSGAGVNMSAGTVGIGIEDFVNAKNRREEVLRIINLVCTPDEILVIKGIFFEEKSMRLISEENGITTNKVSEFRKKALAKIASAIEGSSSVIDPDDV